MEKINFEDGQLVEKAYTTINGTKHYVEKATYSGSTPLSAYVLNKMQQNIETAIEEKSSLPTGGTTGQVLAKASDVDGDVEWVEQSGGNATVGDTLPVGSVVEWYSDTIPEDWLLCNGQAVSRTDYADLFSILGTKYGTGNGSTTFNLPNLQGRVPVGKDSNDTEFNTLGKTGGEKAHTLTVAEMARHNHDFIDNNSGITKTIAAMKNGGSNELSQTSGSKHYDYFYVNYTGESKPHNNLQPFTVCNFIIKAKQSIVGGITGRTIINKTNVDVATATLTNDLNFSMPETWTEYKINFDNVDNNNFILQDGRIKIGKGISKILVSANISFTEELDGAILLFARKNNTTAKSVVKQQSEAYFNISMPEQPIDVQEGDAIDICLMTSVAQENKTIRKNSAYMTIVAIKDDVVPLTSEESIKLLWENPNPKTEFAEQTIQLSEDIENYKYYEVIYYINTDGKRIKSTGLLPIETAMLDLSMHYNVIRTVSEIKGTNLTFSDGVHYKTYGTATTTVSNSFIIPYKVMGYKDTNLLIQSDIVVSPTEPETDRRKVWFQKGTNVDNAIFVKNDSDVYKEFMKKDEELYTQIQELISKEQFTVGIKNPNVNWNEIIKEGFSSIYTFMNGTTLGTGAPSGASPNGTLITINSGHRTSASWATIQIYITEGVTYTNEKYGIFVRVGNLEQWIRITGTVKTTVE